MVGLIVSGATAIPVILEVNFVYRVLHHFGIWDGAFHDWMQTVLAALLDTRARYPFLFYGLDWLAFGHFAIALAFIGPLREPVRNVWVIQFGLVACVLVVPYAFVFGAIRSIPVWWRLIDASFGIIGFVPLWLAYVATKKLEQQQ